MIHGNVRSERSVNKRAFISCRGCRYPRKPKPRKITDINQFSPKYKGKAGIHYSVQQEKHVHRNNY
jgi:hypothetical protein